MPAALAAGARVRGDVQKSRLGPLEGRQPFSDLRQLAVAEPAAHPAGVSQLTALVGRQVKGSEAGPASLGRREADDHEIVRSVRPHLEPVARPAASVGAVGLLGDDALQLQTEDVLVDVLAPFLEVVHVPDEAGLRQHPPEDRLAGDERKLPEVKALKGKQVEGVEGDGHPERAHLDVGSAP